ncbi:MW1434 family type I TA system toxin [Methylorubrum rhodesianum]|uniref:DUF2829 domain-containing protein n=1 Tax=Methylorubrum rhodesianum TaxID=29427 RepID=UPI00129CF815|nr:DUF2829 domain-containing protein [Methylorubrum rhodesianum]MBB5762435.1 hypothetical protein [Methylorubrum rhodesianum]MRI57350.1 DUF2829 domain-containing protein [Methylobacterium sp. DB1607]
MSPFNPTHVSHKRVEAYPIAAAEFASDGSGKVGVNHPEHGYLVVPVPPGFLRRPDAVTEGDMLVRYEPTAEEPHGYLSHSPRAVFEAGYAPVSKSSAMSFGEALAALKAGHRVAREGWNGKGMWLALSGVIGGRRVDADKFWSPHNEAFARENGGSATVLPCITMKTASGEILMGWLASQTDMLADDWMVVPAA